VALFRALFVPAGELPPDYVAFQVADSVQALTSYVRGTLTLRSTLMGGMGVFSTDPAGATATATATAALGVLATFMAKEMSGHVSSLVFSLLAATHFDAELRWWRLFADLANDAGLTLEMVAPLLGARWFLPCTVAGNVCRSLCGVAAGSTRAALSAHFGARGNVADVQSREGSQETAVTMVGLAVGYLFGASLNATVPVQLAVFAVLTAVHIIANVVAVRALHLRTINPGRAAVLTRSLLSQAADAPPPSPAEVSESDAILPLSWRPWTPGARVHIGARLSSLPASLHDALVVRVWADRDGVSAKGTRHGQPAGLQFDAMGHGGMALVAGCCVAGTLAIIVATPTTAWVLVTTEAGWLLPHGGSSVEGGGFLWSLHVVAQLAVQRCATDGDGGKSAAGRSPSHARFASVTQEWASLAAAAPGWLARGGWDVASGHLLDCGWRVASDGDAADVPALQAAPVRPSLAALADAEPASEDHESSGGEEEEEGADDDADEGTDDGTYDETEVEGDEAGRPTAAAALPPARAPAPAPPRQPMPASRPGPSRSGLAPAPARPSDSGAGGGLRRRQRSRSGNARGVAMRR
jgi:hypothetical protein